MTSVRLHVRPSLAECILHQVSTPISLDRAHSTYLFVSNGNTLTKTRLQDFAPFRSGRKLSQDRLRQCQQHHGCRRDRCEHSDERQIGL
jgi:hypothetical protein